MKKAITLFIISLSLMLTACGKGEEGGSKPEQTAKQVGTPKVSSSQAEGSSDEGISASSQASYEKSDTKYLVAYFTPAENGIGDAMTSASKVSFWGEDMGNAEAMANVVASHVGGDLFSIQTVKDYPLEYDDLADDAKAEQERGDLPELATQVDMSGYSTVFVVYPIWWYTMPQPIYSFFEEYDFSGKTVIPFCTSAGNVLTGKESDLPKYGKGMVMREGLGLEGKRVQENPESARADVMKWLKRLGFAELN